MATGRTLMAASRSSRVSLARYTSPIPPAPIGARITYGPILSPAESGISRIQFSVADQQQLCLDHGLPANYRGILLISLPSSFYLCLGHPDDARYHALGGCLAIRNDNARRRRLVFSRLQVISASSYGLPSSASCAPRPACVL